MGSIAAEWELAGEYTGEKNGEEDGIQHFLYLWNWVDNIALNFNQSVFTLINVSHITVFLNYLLIKVRVEFSTCFITF